ncbi:F0F1 ATP synthase subunit B [Pseudohongiella sp. SYSU M77423]|jgi:F-type H+-transporting ATPase subunit b|uniref:F0F1 ATP synthase subunit B n=1 Tax=unclassified Pseudohongiella TaxID=2629611 RepID=UPI000C98C1A7|nr:MULTISPECIES: F0F1 ATP synthase subunit B [unclassified Pseudohongiella]MAY55150.1 F0F1 ATP synthase subunit B [Gammaproteobacteria bacterium]MDH7944279.1 F0F1 ATP synthase subunit B [Pseudohongiella sp. SYSU M77423]MEC8859731.1 F0F1 ATP synthase subunit B [Pseudomonadota bacterium]HBN14382.1 F0F1 ATP synthase subunit B [Pseudohongiella sp.]|tara:strand:+ start:2253 stop:2723 length:471 start_codon:yes stop_codon:yes gene_type:complete
MNLNATIIGQTIAFAVFVWFCLKYVWPPITQALAERQKKIAEGLEAADRAQRDLSLAQNKAADDLREAKIKSAEIIDMANKRANQIVDEAKEKARDEGQRLIAGAKAEIEMEVQRAKEELRAQVAAIAIAGAEKILESSVDKAANEELVKKLASEL